MKKILKNNSKTKEYLNSLPKIYVTARWAKWGVKEYPFSGEFKEAKLGNCTYFLPLVYDYRDNNGTTDEYHLVPLPKVTTGQIADWSFYPFPAQDLADYYNSKEEKNAPETTSTPPALIYINTNKTPLKTRHKRRKYPKQGG